MFIAYAVNILLVSSKVYTHNKITSKDNSCAFFKEISPIYKLNNF